jgi:integrase
VRLLSSPGKRKSALKTATVNRRMACLRHLFSKAKEWKIIADHPCEGVKQLRENNGRTRFLDIEECTALLDACPSPTLRHIVELALNTGMRKSEILRLKWKHINLRRGFLEILDQKNGGYSTIPLNQTLVQLFKKIPRRLDSEYVFPGTKPGNPYFDLKRQFEKTVTDAKLEGVTFHTLRHTAASHMVMNGIDLTTVKEILRHKEFSTTLRYAHLSPDHKQSAVETLGTALKKSVKKSNKTA